MNSERENSCGGLSDDSFRNENGMDLPRAPHRNESKSMAYIPVPMKASKKKSTSIKARQGVSQYFDADEGQNSNNN